MFSSSLNRLIFSLNLGSRSMSSLKSSKSYSLSYLEVFFFFPFFPSSSASSTITPSFYNLFSFQILALFSLSNTLFTIIISERFFRTSRSSEIFRVVRSYARTIQPSLTISPRCALVVNSFQSEVLIRVK